MVLEDSVLISVREAWEKIVQTLDNDKDDDNDKDPREDEGDDGRESGWQGQFMVFSDRPGEGEDDEEGDEGTETEEGDGEVDE